MGDRVDQRLADLVRAAVAYDEAERRGSSAQMTPRSKALVIAFGDYNDAVHWARDGRTEYAAAGGPKGVASRD
ncbi:hypothetical protein [Methylobacterium gossipiicola]|uniref:Uncharacterized protein n=1 Tax=Methylobacterium gossipiicola TaxID=582675 RepID=A0A1I2WT75_9HYPH|nr:hypothetical protein [Methylobacterium gossipiicola]SFH04534.1 hypothetical protein SAMN05192565_12716 [Methylobacterium gossipiicola]